MIEGAGVPASWQLDFAVPLTFIALAIPTLKDRPTLVAAGVAGVVAVAGMGLPYNLGLPLAALVGIAVGLWIEGREAAQSAVRGAA